MQTLIAPSFAPSRPLLSHPLKLVVLGDSLVYGFGDFEGGGWVERLRRRWMSPDSPGHVLYNLGVRGDGVKQVSERLENEFRHRGELRNRFPDSIILSVGINDSARLGRTNGRNYTDFSLYKTILENLLARSQQLCPVLFVGMVPVDEEKMPFLDCLYYNHTDQYRYKEAAKQICQNYKIPYLDLFDLWMQRGNSWCKKQLIADGLHPNINGYKTILEDVLNWEPIVKLSMRS